MFLGGCPCCGPCWKCHEPCDGLVVEIEVIGLEGDLGDPYNVIYIDDTAETGIPIGTILRPWRSRVQDTTGDTFLDYAYSSPNASRPPDIHGPAGSTVFGGSIKCSVKNLVWDVGDKTWEAPGVPLVDNGNQFNLLRVGSPFGTGFSYDPILSIPKEQLENNGTYTFSHTVRLYTEFDGAPVVARIDLLARVMNPEDAKTNTTQCFLPKDVPDGWEPVGKCHDTEEECEAACPAVPFCQCDEPNVLENELTVSFRNVNDSGYVPSDTENLTCSPEALLAQITSLSFNSPFLFFRYQGSTSPPPEGVDFDEAVWGSESNDPRDVMQASVQCVNYGPNLKNPIRCKIDETFPPSCLKPFTKDEVEYTPKGIRLVAGGTAFDNETPPGKLCEFANTGTIVQEYSKLLSPDDFSIGAIWENLNYPGDDPLNPEPAGYGVLVSIFTADLLLTVNSTLPPGGRTMPTKTTGPGTGTGQPLEMVWNQSKRKGLWL